MSMVNFTSAEYSDGKVIADKELRERIIEIGIREISRETGIHTDTVTLIAKGARVKAATLVKVTQRYFSTVDTRHTTH